MPEAQGSDDGPQLGPVACLEAIVSPRTLLFQAARDDKRLALKAQTLDKRPTRPRIGLAVVETRPIGHDEEGGGIVGVGAPDDTRDRSAEHMRDARENRERIT